MMKRHDFAFQVKASDDKTGEFSGYGSVFDVVDSVRDVVRKGAFTDTLKSWASKSKLPAMLWQHDQRNPIGIWTSMKEDDVGLQVEGRILVDAGETEKRAYAHMKAGSVSGLSIGYRVPQGGGDYDAKADVFNLRKLDLHELSVVTLPCCEEAEIDAVKAALGSPREFERFLRDAGLSRTQAKALMARGWDGIAEPLREAEGDATKEAEAAVDHITRLTQAIRGFK